MDMDKIKNISKAGSISIIPQRMYEWVNFCVKCYYEDKLFIIKDLVLAMKLLDEKSLSYLEIMNSIDLGQYSGQNWEIIEKALAKYHPLGVNFVRGINERVRGTSMDEYLEKMKIENEFYLKQDDKFKR